jgi:hypothetical protein
MTPMLNQFLLGAVAMGMTVASLFFLRYWRESRDRLFAWFALAFFILVINRLVLAFPGESNEISIVPYLGRLLAFGVIIGAIVDKNLRRD